MLHVSACLWDATIRSAPASRCYDDSWAVKLYFGFQRNLTRPFRFVLFTERDRDLPAEIVQERLETLDPTWAAIVEPYKLNEPSILVGMDTVITGNIDHLADYVLAGNKYALPRDPYHHSIACNGVQLVPAGMRHVFDDWRGENDMEWCRGFPHDFIDDLWPGHVVSYKKRVLHHGLGDARIVYFHGTPKMHEIAHVPWVRDNWRDF
jgi:hypothetical protein